MVSKAKTPKKQAKKPKKKVAKKSKTTTKKTVKKTKTTAKKPVKEEKKPEKKPIFEHVLVPKHRLLTDEEKQALLKKYKIGLNQLPRIKSSDPVMKLIKDFKPGDVLEIERKSLTAGKTKYYRVIRSD